MPNKITGDEPAFPNTATEPSFLNQTPLPGMSIKQFIGLQFMVELLDANTKAYTNYANMAFDAAEAFIKENNEREEIVNQ